MLLRATAFLLVAAASLGAAELTVDHVSVAGRDLKQMQTEKARQKISSLLLCMRQMFYDNPGDHE